MNMRQWLQGLCRLSVAAGGLLGGVPALAAVSIADVPLYVQIKANPNVMILFDNSGSMDSNVLGSDPTYHDQYRSSTTYASFQVCTNANNQNTGCRSTGWSTLTAALVTASAPRAGCSSGWKRVRKIPNGTDVCMRLPDNLTVSTGTGSHTYELNYVNFLLDQYDGGTSSERDIRQWFAVASAGTRLDVAKAVVAGTATESGIVDIPGIRFGLAAFNPASGDWWNPVDRGGHVIASCNDASSQVGGMSHTAYIKQQVNALSADSWTPLAESYYELTRYFRGLTPHYGNTYTGLPNGANIIDGGRYVSPMTNYCQKNYIMVVTDGYPTLDEEFPNDDPFDVATSGSNLPNWDGVRTNDPLRAGGACTNFQDRYFEPYSDGIYYWAPGGQTCAGSNYQNQASSLFLDDLAMFAYQMDVKPDTERDTLGRYYTNLDNIGTFTVGFAVDNQMLNDAAARGAGRESNRIYQQGTYTPIPANRDPNYFTASTRAGLKQALQDVIDSVKAQTASSSAVAATSSRLDTETAIFQARFLTERWTGDIRAFAIEADGDIAADPMWTTSNSSFDPPATRKVFTYQAGSGGIAFDWASLTAAGYAGALNGDADGDGNGDGVSRLAWLLGDTSREVRNGGPFRDRLDERGNSNVLGDIINSDPSFSGPKLDFAWNTLPSSVFPEAASYRAFVDANKNNSGFVSALFVGSNDGMLHAFNGKTGEELFAYVPSSVISKMAALSDPDYVHKYLVDGPSVVGHAYIGGQWRTILIGTNGLGGGTVFALDVTNPGSFSAADVLWEVTPSDMGYSTSRPSLVPLANGRWGVVLGNGYNAASGIAKLFVLDAETGAEIKTLSTGVGSALAPNGMSEPKVIAGANRVAETIYAGDLRGNLWKVDVSGNSAGNWNFAFRSGSTPQPLFTATGLDGLFQPITSGVAVTRHTTGGYMVMFGTGKYFEVTDADGKTTGGDLDKDQQYQTFYGIHDNGARISGRAALAASDFVSGVGDPANSRRIDSGVTADPQGWYLDLDLASSGGQAAGERILLTPSISSGRVLFISILPDNDPCGGGGRSYLMMTDVETGSGFTTPVLDWNNDGVIGSGDSTASGMMLDGLVTGFTTISGAGMNFGYASINTGDLTKTGSEGGAEEAGRASWRQLK